MKMAKYLIYAVLLLVQIFLFSGCDDENLGIIPCIPSYRLTYAAISESPSPGADGCDDCSITFEFYYKYTDIDTEDHRVKKDFSGCNVSIGGFYFTDGHAINWAHFIGDPALSADKSKVTVHFSVDPFLKQEESANHRTAKLYFDFEVILPQKDGTTRSDHCQVYHPITQMSYD